MFEDLLISKWQAPLNFPYITEFLKLKAKGWQLQYRKHNKQFPRVPLGDRLYQRVRRKLQTLNAPITEFSFQTTAWTVLYRLTSPGRISFETAASLRSGKFHDWELYAFFRLAGHLEEPLRSQARQKKKQAFTFRNLTKPTQNSPLTIPFLAHQSFSTDTSKTTFWHSKKWQYHCIFPQQSYGKLPILRSARCYTITEGLNNGGILKMLIHYHAVAIGFKHTLVVSPLILNTLLLLWKIWIYRLN